VQNEVDAGRHPVVYVGAVLPTYFMAAVAPHWFKLFEVGDVYASCCVGNPNWMRGNQERPDRYSIRFLKSACTPHESA